MFYKLPQVRAISRYADFSSHLGRKSFLSMIVLAAFLHACVIGILAMMPHNPVVKIPVRVLNFNLGSASIPQSAQQPVPSDKTSGHEIASPPAKMSIPAPEPAVGEDSASEGEDAQNELEKALTQKPVAAPAKPQAKAEVKTPASANAAKIVAPAPKPSLPVRPKAVTESVEVSRGVALGMPATPRTYVRASPLELTQPQTVANTASSGPEEIVQRYEQAISVWIGRYKVYPEEAKRRRVEGRPTVRVRINRQGKVLYHVIEKSSGDAFLDQALMNMVKAADPMPAVPQNYPQGEELEFLIPVSFSLKGQ